MIGMYLYGKRISIILVTIVVKFNIFMEYNGVAGFLSLSRVRQSDCLACRRRFCFSGSLFIYAHLSSCSLLLGKNVEDISSTTGTSNRLMQRNIAYVENLMQNLENVLDEYVLSSSQLHQEQAYNLVDMIERHTLDLKLLSKATAMVKSAGLSPPHYSFSQSTNQSAHQEADFDKYRLGSTDEDARRQEAELRKKWETFRAGQADAVAVGGRSALSRREINSKDKPDLFVNGVLDDKYALEKMVMTVERPSPSNSPSHSAGEKKIISNPVTAASNFVSNTIAKAGNSNQFNGQALGIGGLDDVLKQIKRRVWTPLAAPPTLLQELGIQPVRGLLLYGKSGNGKSLLARTLGQILSPLRPITIVSGPEIMDKFVGSSEQKLRAIFDSPPEVYEQFKNLEFSDTIESAALHVIIMDEFDAIARQRGGKGGSGVQGDAGVARDSVVNQLLTKMDGVAPLICPTLVIGLTNRRSLIDNALLRPGRFEVQIEVPPPQSTEQKVSILNVHMRHMHRCSRLLVRDTPPGPAANLFKDGNLPTYQELLVIIANQCSGFSGASLAGVARAAASHALERAVESFSQSSSDSDRSILSDCVVTLEDLEFAIQDILACQGDSDWAEDKQTTSNDI